MYSRVPVIPLIKDHIVMTIKTKTFRVALTGGRFDLFDQDMINGSSVEELLTGVNRDWPTLPYQIGWMLKYTQKINPTIVSMEWWFYG